MLEIGPLEIFIIILGVVAGFLMIDTKPSNAARKNIEKGLSDAIPHPREVNSIQKMTAYIRGKKIDHDR